MQEDGEIDLPSLIIGEPSPHNTYPFNGELFTVTNECRSRTILPFVAVY